MNLPYLISVMLKSQCKPLVFQYLEVIDFLFKILVLSSGKSMSACSEALFGFHKSFAFLFNSFVLKLSFLNHF